MLALARSTRAPYRLALHARALTSAAHNAGSPNAAAAEASSSPAPDNTEAAMRQQRTRLTKSSAECLFVYPWNGIRSSAEGLEIARALQGKYGPAKEVVFPRDSGCVNLFQPYFWLVFDNPDVRKLLPEASGQISVQVADLPRSDGNVGLGDMMRGLGLSTSESPPAPTETEASKDDASDAPPGYKSLDLRIEWARHGPGEVLNRKRPISKSHPNEQLLPHFATAWLAFDGFSPESARGPHTPNLLRAREKWRKIARESPSANDVDDSPHTTTSASTVTVPPSQEPIDAGTESELKSELAASEAQTRQKNVAPSSREWVPIVPRGTQRPAHTPNSTRAQKAASASAPAPAPAPASTSPSLDSARTTDTTHAADSTNDDDGGGRASPPPGTGAPTAATKISRRERILHLARRNARTPLPEPVEEPKPPTEAAEKVADEESERQMKERTIRERLWRLVGGNY